MILSLVITRKYIPFLVCVLIALVASIVLGPPLPTSLPSHLRHFTRIQSEDRSSWYMKDKFRKRRGVALVVHGLNQKPERMGAVIGILNRAGVDVLNLSLSGHGNNFRPVSGLTDGEARLETFRRVSFGLWAGEVRSAYLKVRQRAAAKRVPVYFAGFSLGGLLGCDLLASDKNVSFQGMILFAPALNVQIEGHLLKALTPFPNLVIDSLSPPSYRTNDGTPMAAYKALFEAIAHFEVNMSDRLNVPTVVFVHEGDELISYEKLTQLVRTRLSAWRIVSLGRNGDGRGPSGISRHLIIDEGGTGKEAWKLISEKMRRHLGN
jgi:alpha-beta hydrolase superfamily lysophospholipase